MGSTVRDLGFGTVVPNPPIDPNVYVQLVLTLWYMVDDSESETKYTTITVTDRVKEDLDTHRDGRPWSVYLEQLRQEHADPITLNDAEEIADKVAQSVESGVDENELALATADYLMSEYRLPAKVAEELR